MALCIKVDPGEVEINYVDIVVRTADVVVLHIECASKRASVCDADDFEFELSAGDGEPTVVRVVGLSGRWRSMISEGRYSHYIALLNSDAVTASSHSDKPYAWQREDLG
jgi:hypothetical protein